MSATGRKRQDGSESGRQKDDRYITPPWAVHRFLENYTLPQGATVLDPGASEGELLKAIHAVRPDLRLYAVELREECRPALEALQAAGIIQGFVIGNFLALANDFGAASMDFTITNPPYKLAKEFIEASIGVSKIGAAHLLRMGFLGSQERRDWHAQTKPGLRNLPNRPCFTGWGSDATEYTWAIYKDPAVRGTFDVLALTPEDVVSAWNEEAKRLHPDAKPVKKAKAPTCCPHCGKSLTVKVVPAGTNCSVCHEPQFNTPGGVSCNNGHGGAPADEIAAAA